MLRRVGLVELVGRRFQRLSFVLGLGFLGALVFVSMPQFVIALSLLYVFAFWLGWFPIGGYGDFKHIVLPAVTLGLLGGGWYARNWFNRAAGRSREYANAAMGTLGIRVVRELD